MSNIVLFVSCFMTLLSLIIINSSVYLGLYLIIYSRLIVFNANCPRLGTRPFNTTPQVSQKKLIHIQRANFTTNSLLHRSLAPTVSRLYRSPPSRVHETAGVVCLLAQANVLEGLLHYFLRRKVVLKIAAIISHVPYPLNQLGSHWNWHIVGYVDYRAQYSSKAAVWCKEDPPQDEKCVVVKFGCVLP